MKRRAILAVASGVSCVALCHCDPCSTEPLSFAALSEALGHEFGYERFPAGTCPQAAQDPGKSGQAIGSASASACASAAEDDPCVTCAKTSCCAVSLECWQDTSCTCLIACRSAGCTAEETSQCGALEARTEDLTTCLHDHCAKECPAH
jgi:hypothetical protein